MAVYGNYGNHMYLYMENVVRIVIGLVLLADLGLLQT